MYVSISESEREDNDMCLVLNDEGLALGLSNNVSIDDWNEDHHT